MKILKYGLILLECQLLGILHSEIMGKLGYDLDVSVMVYSDDMWLWISFITLAMVCYKISYKLSGMVE